MRLTNLLASSDAKLQGQDQDITGLTADSRKVQPGFLFAAIPGTAHDGRVYIPDAIKRGAVAVLQPPGGSATPSISSITTPDIRKTLSSIASKFYQRQPETIVAVTGTSGKTSTAQFVREVWQALGHKSASIGTLGLITAEENRYGSLTTPDAIELHRFLNEAAEKQITHLAMEASSHGLSMNRLDNVKLKAAAFTNLSHEHLDYHRTMEDYLGAKTRLFTDVLPLGGTAVLNADEPEYVILANHTKERHQKIISFGKKGKDIKLLNITPDGDGQLLNFELFGKKQDVRLPLIGKFQAWNAMCALGLVIASGEDHARAAEALGKVTGVPGRLQLIGHTKIGAAVYVDYAHKPNALENVLTAIRPHVLSNAKSKLGVVFGCGGNRDKGKRPVMGEIACRLADWVIITDDNPRNEDPAEIRKEIIAGCKTGTVSEVPDRAEAINTSIKRLEAGDILIIAGKGHEPGQIIGDKTLPFDDADVARKALGI